MPDFSPSGWAIWTGGYDELTSADFTSSLGIVSVNGMLLMSAIAAAALLPGVLLGLLIRRVAA